MRYLGTTEEKEGSKDCFFVALYFPSTYKHKAIKSVFIIIISKFCFDELNNNTEKKNYELFAMIAQLKGPTFIVLRLMRTADHKHIS